MLLADFIPLAREIKARIYFYPHEEFDCMSLVLERETPPLREDETGAVRVGDSRVLLEIVIRAFQDGASPESIVHRYPTLSLSDVYNAIGYYLRHQDAVNEYLKQREQVAKAVQQRMSDVRPDLSSMRARLLARQDRRPHSC